MTELVDVLAVLEFQNPCYHPDSGFLVFNPDFCSPKTKTMDENKDVRDKGTRDSEI